MKHRFDPAKKTRLAMHVLSRRPTTINLNQRQPCPRQSALSSSPNFNPGSARNPLLANLGPWRYQVPLPAQAWVL